MNLLEETIHAITSEGYTVDDVAYVCRPKWYITFKEFSDVAKNIFYDNGYGSQEISSQLCIVFHDKSWLERSEYDGSEGWEYKSFPKLPDLHMNNLVAEQLFHKIF